MTIKRCAFLFHACKRKYIDCKPLAYHGFPKGNNLVLLLFLLSKNNNKYGHPKDDNHGNPKGYNQALFFSRLHALCFFFPCMQARKKKRLIVTLWMTMVSRREKILCFAQACIRTALNCNPLPDICVSRGIS